MAGGAFGESRIYCDGSKSVCDLARLATIDNNNILFITLFPTGRAEFSVTLSGIGRRSCGPSSRISSADRKMSKNAYKTSS